MEGRRGKAAGAGGGGIPPPHASCSLRCIRGVCAAVAAAGGRRGRRGNGVGGGGGERGAAPVAAFDHQRARHVPSAPLPAARRGGGGRRCVGSTCAWRRGVAATFRWRLAAPAAATVVAQTTAVSSPWTTGVPRRGRDSRRQRWVLDTTPPPPRGSPHLPPPVPLRCVFPHCVERRPWPSLPPPAVASGGGSLA